MQTISFSRSFIDKTKQNMQKAFPLDVEILFGEKELKLWFENVWGGTLSVDLIGNDGKIKARDVISDKKPFAEFNELQHREAYNLKVKFRNMYRRVRYKPYRKGVVFNGQSTLRIQGVSAGRSGTTSLSRWLDGLMFESGDIIHARHETLAYRILQLISEKKLEKVKEIVKSFPHNVEIAPYFLFAPDSIIGDRVLFIVRDGRDVVASGMRRGWYTRNSIWDRVKPDFPGTPFEKSCRLWAKSCADFLYRADFICRMEDLSHSNDERQALLKKLNIVPTVKPFPHNNVSLSHFKKFEWSRSDYEIFEEHCGFYMDMLYPGWKQDMPALI